MTYQTITCEREGPLAIVTLRRPERLNALNVEMVKELGLIVGEIQKDEDLRVMILTGGMDSKGRPCFCAGADMKEAPFPETFLPDLNSLIHRIEDLGKATIAAIDGICTAGGLELALCFDLRVAAETARIGDLHLKNLGVGLGGAGASTRLPRIVGLANAKELMFTGDLVDGREAYRIGLANKVCPSDKLMEVARALGQKIAPMRPQGLAVTKTHLNLGIDMELHQARRFEEIIGLLADREGKEEILKRQLAFAAKSQAKSAKAPVHPHPEAASSSGEPVPIKEGLFPLPPTPGEAPRLIGSRCRSCREVYFPPKRDTNCPYCFTEDMEELPLNRTGRVLSYTIVHQAPREWQGPVPYTLALVELPEKVRFYAALTGCEPSQVTTGMEVELAIEKVRMDSAGREVMGYKFRPIEQVRKT